MTVRRDVPVVLGLWLITIVGQASVGPVADVKVVAGRVHIQATAISVSEILNRLSRTTGMKVVYDGAPPIDRVTAAIDAASETEALSRLLEGLGLTYAFKLDAAGRHVETLFVTSASSRRASSGTAATTAGSSRMTQVATEDFEINGVPEDQDTVNDTVAVGPDGAPMDPTSPGYAGGPVGGQQVVGQVGQVVPGLEDPNQNPSFPSGASFPGSTSPAPGSPGFPAFPGPASYP